MQFLDEVRIRVISGRGGDGSSSFRRERYVPYGGPDGGDGGRGGDVVLVADGGLNTLLALRKGAFFKADSGDHGSGRDRTGRTGRSLELAVPVGTRVLDEESGELLADLTEEGQRWVAAEGGRGGLGNVHFKSSVNRAPRKCTPGGPPEDRWLRLELRLMADVGLLGFPNAGKSTLISRISAARPRVADYPFTTLTPSLGMVSVGLEGSFVVADIPGLIRGAAEGAGLGHQFLRHLQRNRVLWHLVSLSELDDWPDEDADAEADRDGVGVRYAAIRHELAAFDDELAAVPEVVVLTTRDTVDEARVEAARKAIAALAPDREVFVVSSVTGEGVSALVNRTWERLGAMLSE